MTDTGFGALLFGVCLVLIGLRMPVAVASSLKDMTLDLA